MTLRTSADRPHKLIAGRSLIIGEAGTGTGKLVPPPPPGRGSRPALEGARERAGARVTEVSRDVVEHYVRSRQQVARERVAIVGEPLRKRKILTLPNVVLVVDDDPSTLKSVERLLRVRGFNAELLESGEELLSRANLQAALCLLLDVHLPGLTGTQVGERVAGSEAALPVIFMTANDCDAVRKAALNAGCVAYLSKPFSSQMLASAVDARRGAAPRALTGRDARRRIESERRRYSQACASICRQTRSHGSIPRLFAVRSVAPHVLERMRRVSGKAAISGDSVHKSCSRRTRSVASRNAAPAPSSSIDRRLGSLRRASK
jgi:FixJ family two-component response regulator